MDEPIRCNGALLPDSAAIESLLSAHPFAMGYFQAGRLTWVNPAMAETFGFESQDELQGLQWQELYADSTEFDRAHEAICQRLHDSRTVEKEGRFRRKDGSAFGASHMLTAVHWSDQQVTDAWIAVYPWPAGMREQGLRESEERYRNLVEGSFDGIFLRHTDRIVFANSRLSEMLGYTEAELKSLDRWEIYHPDDRKIVQERTNVRVLGDHVPPRYDVRLLRKDGSSFPAELDARVFRVEGEPLIQVCVRDISERKRAEEERLHLVTAIEHAAEIIAITDADGAIRYVNPAVETITGYSRDEIVGDKLRALGNGLHDKASYARMKEALGRGNVWSGRVVDRKKNGAKFETEISVSPVRGDDEEVIGYVAVMRDVTNEVALETQLRQAAKMEALGTLAGGIAHDFNNILYVIMGFAEISLEAAAGETRLKSYLRQVLLAANRAKDLVDQILTFSRQSDHEKQLIRIGPLIEETLTFLRASIPTTIEIRPQMDVDTDLVCGDPTQIHQIIMNLCSNAAHAMGQNGGVLGVNLGREDFDANRPAPCREITQESYLRLSISDTGHGMKPDVLERIFEPYFSTKAKGQGTGLGLAMVHGIVKDHRGVIRVQSVPDRGTVFDVYLPLVHSEDETEAKESEWVPTGKQRILVVDDERSVIDMLKEMLESLGYLVEISDSSLDALKLFRSRAHQFDLVITDLTMPGMTGTELARELLGIRPTIPIVLCTGNGQLLSEPEAKKIGMRALLVKPVARKKLAQTIRKVLDKT